MAKILITGAMGQLGRALNKILLETENYEIYNTDIKKNTDEFIGDINSLDITDSKMVEKTFNEFKPDVIVNCAAYTAVDLCETDQANAYRINVEGPKNLAIAAQNINCKIVQISTDYVFDGMATTPYTEEMQGNPQSIYGLTKYEAEEIVMQFCSKSFIIRTAWMYGDGKNFVKTMLRLSECNNEIKVVDDQFGTPTSAKEVARLIAYLIETDAFGIYHGTCQGSTNWYEFATEIFKLSQRKIFVKPIKSSEFPVAAKRPTYSVLENKRLTDETDFIFADWHEELSHYIISLDLQND